MMLQMKNEQQNCQSEQKWQSMPRREIPEQQALYEKRKEKPEEQKLRSHGEVLSYGEKYLRNCQVADASVDAWLLLEFVTGISRALFLADRNRPMKDEQKKQYLELLQKRGSHIPLQHLTGEQEFMGLVFQVNEHVLIPRQDTETLVEEALNCLQAEERQRKAAYEAASDKKEFAAEKEASSDRPTVLDLCTGSGCIAISLAKLSKASVEGSDISEEALEVARGNAARLKASVPFKKSDLFEGIEGTYDMIVSNPPYIRTSVIEELSEEVRFHEPYGALDGKEDGLYFYRRIAKESRQYLKEGGWLLLEIGYDQGAEVSGLLAEHEYHEIEVIKDLAGQDRVVRARSRRK